MSAQKVINFLLVFVLLLGYLGWHQWQGRQMQIAMSAPIEHAENLVMVHFYTDW